MPKGIYLRTQKSKDACRRNFQRATQVRISKWVPVSLTCKYCMKSFSVGFKYRNKRKYCSKSCAGLDMPISSRKSASEKMKGRSPIHKGKSYVEFYGKERAALMISEKRLQTGGKNNPMFNNWSSFEPYTKEFNNELKELIRNRDNRLCQLCGMKEKEDEKLSVNHINYNKEDCRAENLNALCRACNARVNTNRDFFTLFFRTRMSISY